MWAHIIWLLFQSFLSHNFLFHHCMPMIFLHFVHSSSGFEIQVTEWKYCNRIWFVKQQGNASHNNYISQHLILAKLKLSQLSAWISGYNKWYLMLFSLYSCLVGLFYLLLINKSLSYKVCLYYKTIAWFVICVLLYQDYLFSRYYFLPDAQQDDKGFKSS